MVFIKGLLKNIESKINDLQNLNSKAELIKNLLLKEEEKIIIEKTKVEKTVELYKTEKINLIQEFVIKEKDLAERITQWEEKVLKKENFQKDLFKETFSSISWLAKEYADFSFLMDDNQLSKFESSLKAVATSKILSKENKDLRKKSKELELKIKYFESLQPDFNEIVESNFEEHFTEIIDDDTVETMSKIDSLVDIAEQQTKTRTEILQIALERFINRKKSNYAVGQDYERYIGYLYEQKGYFVEYHGIKHGFDDLGIDLICKKEDETLLIQCKNWSIKKYIYENAINQLFGTAIKYYIDKFDNYQRTLQGSLFNDVNIPFNESFKPIFITTTKLTERAEEFAKILKIEVLVIPYEKNFPRIKCNIGKDEYGNPTEIYHLPFDQMYDRVQNIKNGGFNALTIEEAENAKYRKAFRWRGE